MVFAPKLSEGVAFNQPVQQPNAMEAIAGLFSFGVDTLKTRGDAPKPTEDEKFGASVREFEANNSIGGTADWNNNLMRKFIFQYPEHDPAKIKGYAGGLGVQTETPIEVARDAAVEWFKTPEGVTAVAATQGLPPEERDAEISRRVTVAMEQNAKLAQLQLDASILEAEGTLDTARWDILKPTSKNMVDDAVTLIAPIFDEVMLGGEVKLTPQEQEMLKVKYDTITLENLPAVLRDTKMFLETQARLSFQGYYGEDQLPPEDWNKEVFSSINSLITLGESIDSPQERAAAQKALIQYDLYKNLDENGVALIAAWAEVVPADTLNRFIGDMAGYDKAFIEALSGDGRVFSTSEIAKNAANMSTSEADTNAKNAITLIETHITPELFTLFDEARKRSGYEVVDGPTFNNLLEGNVEEIKRLSTSSPDFRKRFSGFLTSDIQQTISLINSNLPTEVRLIQQKDGKFALTYTGTIPERGARASALESDYDFKARSVREATKGLPDGLNLDTLNEKLGALGLLGDVGKEVQEAIGILNQPEKSKSGSSSSSSSKSTKGTDIGTALGIDFAKYETEAGLPPGFLNKMAMIESGGNPNAQNDSSSAGGLFQQIDSNAAEYGVANRFDPVQSTEGAVRFAIANKNYLTGILGREPTGGELYLAHQQGPGGAAKLLANPDAKAVDIVGMDAIKLNGGNANMTAGEFANIWISKYNGSRGQTTGSYSAGAAPTALSLDSGASEVPKGARGAVEALPARLEGNLISFDSPEVQQVVAQSQTNPEESVRMAKELLAGKPMDPQVKALIEALVRIGERA